MISKTLQNPISGKPNPYPTHNENSIALQNCLAHRGTAIDATFNSKFNITSGVDYCVAAVFSLTDDNVNFHFQDLTNNGSLLSSTVANNFTDLHNSTAN